MHPGTHIAHKMDDPDVKSGRGQTRHFQIILVRIHMPRRPTIVRGTRQQPLQFLLQWPLVMQEKPLKLRAPDGAFRCNDPTGATPLKPEGTTKLAGPAMLVPRLWRRQNSRRFTQADDLRMRPKGQIQHGRAAVAETTDQQQLQALAAHRLRSTRSLRSIVI